LVAVAAVVAMRAAAAQLRGNLVQRGKWGQAFPSLAPSQTPLTQISIITLGKVGRSPTKVGMVKRLRHHHGMRGVAMMSPSRVAVREVQKHTWAAAAAAAARAAVMPGVLRASSLLVALAAARVVAVTGMMVMVMVTMTVCSRSLGQQAARAAVAS